jgi:hypothetical protein
VSKKTDFPVVQSDELNVLTVRRMLADQTAVAQALAELLPEVADVIAGPPLALRTGFPRDGKAPYDLAFPVRKPVERDGFELKTLHSFPAFSIVHRGHLTGGPEGANLNDTWAPFAQFVGDRTLLLGDDPVRFIYHEGIETVGTDSEQVHLEIQYPYHMPMWLEAFREGVEQCVDSEAAGRVLKGSDDLAEAFDGKRAAEWVQGAVERLDQEVPDERTRACILNACSHHYIVQSGEVLKGLWEESGHDLRVLMKLIAEEPLLGSTYWIEESGENPILYIRRRPARMEAYEQATDPLEKRYQACFCPLVRDAIRDKKTVSRTFCHCSSGWYVQEWEPIFGEKPRVDLVETMIEGADACVFAVRIPPGFL